MRGQTEIDGGLIQQVHVCVRYRRADAIDALRAVAAAAVAAASLANVARLGTALRR